MTFIVGFLIICGYCSSKDGYTLKSITLPDWLNYFTASGTVGGFLYVLLDKILSEKEENHLKWQSEIPFITLTSPCDPSLNYCDINIMENDSNSISTGRGNEYFSVCNLGKVNAYDVAITFSTDEKFIETKVFNRHYITYLCPLKVVSGTYLDATKETVNGEQVLYPRASVSSYYEFKESIYSNYNVDPVTKEINNNRFDICNHMSNCTLSPNSTFGRYFFVRFVYYSSFAKRSRYKITSDFKVHVMCNPEPILETSSNVIKIKGITLIQYDYQFDAT